MGTITTLPTAPSSYFTVSKRGRRYLVQIATPAGGSTISTTVATAATYEDAVAEARRIGELRQRPVKLPVGERSSA